MELDHPYLFPTLWGTTDGAARNLEYVPFEAVVGGDADEVGDPVLFAVLVEVKTCKGCIPSEPEFLEPGSVTIDKRRDNIQDAIG